MKNNKDKHKRSEIKNSILVFNIPLNTSPSDLKILFETHGPLTKLNTYFVPWKMNTFNAKIFFENKEDAKKARDALNGV